MLADITLRRADSQDRDFLFQVYADKRAVELAQIPWTDEQKQQFLWQQFEAQDASYRQNYPNAEFSVIERNMSPIGRLSLAQLDGGELRIIDIALLSAHRGSGIGSGLLADILRDADQRSLTASLHVELGNPALHLYERLGFAEASRNDVHILMERRPVPPPPGSTTESVLS